MNVAIEHAIKTYHELNAAVIDELLEEPSPLEFMRFSARNRPFVVRRAASAWQATERWNADYLRHTMGSQNVNVAITPCGNADAVVEEADGKLLFVEPHEQLEPFENFLDYVLEDSNIPDEKSFRNVKYAQTQNDNLREEYSSLFTDVPKDIPFARIALDKGADAINMWIGNGKSVTSLHKDNYENIYIQIRGRKHFVLLPPVEMPCVNEKSLARARYQLVEQHDSSAGEELHVERNEDDDSVPVAIWDPDEPDKWTTPYSHFSKPLRVTLREGDMLYLPAMWYHKVSQTAGEEGFACAVNYWYDMDFAGGFWTANSFIRDIYNAST